MAPLQEGVESTTQPDIIVEDEMVGIVGGNSGGEEYRGGVTLDEEEYRVQISSQYASQKNSVRTTCSH